MNSPNPMWPFLVAAVFPWAVILVAAFMAPRLTRPDIFFSVTVNPALRRSADGFNILSRYQQWMVVFALLGLPLFGFLRSAPPLKWIGLFGPLTLEMAGLLSGFLIARQRTLPHHAEPTTEREAVVMPRRVPLPGGWIGQAGPFAILGLVLFLLWFNWDRIPGRVPVHWGAAGQPDGWAAKSPAVLFGQPLIAMLLCALFAGLFYSMIHGSRRIHGAGRGRLREARFLHAISCLMLAVEYWLAILFALFCLAPLRPDPNAPLRLVWPILLGDTLIVAVVFFIAWRMGQGGWRLAAREGGSRGEDNSENAGPPVADRTPDACWKLGLFYYNPDDPVVWVEKRFGVGWTLNFGNPRAWLVLGAIFLLPIAALALKFLVR